MPVPDWTSDSSTATWAVERWARDSQQPNKSQTLDLWEMMGCLSAGKTCCHLPKASPQLAKKTKGKYDWRGDYGQEVPVGEESEPWGNHGTGSLSNNSGPSHGGEQPNPESSWLPSSYDMVGQDLPRYQAH